MHREFVKLIAAVLTELPAFVDSAQVAIASEIQNFACSSRAKNKPYIEVEAAPEKIGHALTSNICFHLAGNLGGIVTPLEVANLVLSVIEHFQSNVETAGEYFKIEIGGPGHLNASLSAHGKETLLERLQAEHVTIFFSDRSLLFSGVEEISETIEYPKPDWQRALGRALQQESDPLIAELLARISARLKAGDSNSEASPDLMMLLAVIADPELDLRIFNSGVYNQDNVPWYLSKFLADTLSISQKNSTIDLDLSAPSQFSPEAGLSKFTLSQYLHLRDFLLGFRHSVIESARRKKPEMLFMSLIDLSRRFFAFYNCPDCRSLLLSTSSTSDAELQKTRGAVGRTIRIAREIMLGGLSRLGLPNINQT